MPHKTPLHDIHLSLGAKVIDFHGWLLPVQYSGIIEEHLAVRNCAGLFDLSHMGEIEVEGEDAKKYLNYILCGNIDKVSYDGKIMYSGLLNESGGFVDDLLVYRKSEYEYLLVVNASNADQDYLWMKKSSAGFKVEIKNISLETGLIALQGPKSAEILASAIHNDYKDMFYYHFTQTELCGKPVIISRTGYTGEDGFEIYAPWNDLPEIWDFIYNIAAKFGAKPIGLGARDTLRLEMRYPLHGNDIDETTTPIEAGLSWIVDLKKGGFVGKEKLQEQKLSGINRILTGFVMEDKGIPRKDYEIFRNDEPAGIVTSGTLSPSLSQGIGLAYIDPEKVSEGGDFFVSIHGKKKKINLVKGSFVKSKTYTSSEK